MTDKVHSDEIDNGARTPMCRSPTTPGQSSRPMLFQDPLLTWFVRAAKSFREGTVI